MAGYERRQDACRRSASPDRGQVRRGSNGWFRRTPTASSILTQIARDRPGRRNKVAVSRCWRTTSDIASRTASSQERSPTRTCGEAALPCSACSGLSAMMRRRRPRALRRLRHDLGDPVGPDPAGSRCRAVVQAVVSKRRDDAAAPRRLARGRSPSRAALGAPRRRCSYAAVALARSLFRKGADFTAAMAFEFASTNLVIELGDPARGPDRLAVHARRVRRRPRHDRRSSPCCSGAFLRTDARRGGAASRPTAGCAGSDGGPRRDGHDPSAEGRIVCRLLSRAGFTAIEPLLRDGLGVDLDGHRASAC